MQQNMRPITKPDLNSVFEAMLPLAKSNPQYINAYLLTGTPEQKLAAAMIKDMPQSQAPAAPAQAPTQTVIDQKAAQVDPGIAALPMAEGMYDEQSMAAGGIVAFDDGGTIAYNRALQNSFLGPDALGMAGTLVDRYAPNVKNLVKEAGGFLVDKISGMRWVRNPYTGELQRASEVVENPNSGKFAYLGPMGDNQAPPAEGLASIPTPFAALPITQQKVNLGNTAAQPVTEASPAAAPKAAPKAAPTTDPRLATGRDLGYDLPDIKVTKLTEPAGLSTLDALNQHKQALEEAGIDPDYYSKQAEKLTEQKEALKGDKEQAAWMALARAGFGMAAGKSQFGLSNLAEGAQMGLDQYGRDIKDIKADEKLLRAADQKLEDAKYAQSRGDAERAESLMRQREELIFQTKAKNVELENTAEMKRAELKGDRSKTMYTEQGANQRTAMQINANKAINQADNNSRERIAELTAGVSLSEKQRANVDKVSDNAKAQIKLEVDAGAQYDPAQIQKRIDELTYNGLAQLGIKLPGITKPAGPAAGALSKPGAGGVRDYIPLAS
jgi:hypothetical protein